MAIFIDALSARNGGGITYIENLIDTIPKSKNLNIYIIFQKNVLLNIKYKKIIQISTKWPVQNPIFRAVWQFFILPIILYKLKIKIFFVPGGINICKIPSFCKMITMFRNMLPFDEDQVRRYPFGLSRLKFIAQKYLILNTLRKADFVIFISNFSKSFIVKKIPHLKKKCSVIPHGVDQKFFLNKNKNLNYKISPKGKYILYVSRIEYYKRQIEVLAAFLKVSKVYKDLKLYFIGPDSNSYAKELSRLIIEKKLSNKVFILGEVKQVYLPNFFKNAFINVFISETENCPNILLEALSAGKPVICSNRDPMPEFGGEAPLYCSPNDPSEIANKILKIIRNKKIYIKMSSASIIQSKKFKKKSLGKITWDTIINNFY